MDKVSKLIASLPDPPGDYPPPSIRFQNSLTKLLPPNVSTVGMNTNVIKYLKMLNSQSERLEDPLPTFQSLLNEAQLDRGGKTKRQARSEAMSGNLLVSDD